MKRNYYYMGAVIASLFMGATSSYADCPNGRCYDREDVFTDVLEFSRGLSNCPTLSSQQALRVASAASRDQLDVAGFKRAYASSCNLNISMAAARDGYTAETFTRVLEYSKSLSNCPTLSHDHAFAVADAASSRQLSPEGFKTAYGSSCDYNISFAAARDERKAHIFQEVLNYSKSLSNCPTLSSDRALEVADAARSGRLSPRGFKTAYRSSCDYNASFAAARDERKADIFQDVLDYSKSLSNCPTLTTDRALEVATAANSGRINADDFKLAYRSSCNYYDSLSAAACQTFGSIVKGDSDIGQRLALSRESVSSSKADLIPLALDFAPAKSVDVSTSSAMAN